MRPIDIEDALYVIDVLYEVERPAMDRDYTISENRNVGTIRWALEELKEALLITRCDDANIIFTTMENSLAHACELATDPVQRGLFTLAYHTICDVHTASLDAFVFEGCVPGSKVGR